MYKQHHIGNQHGGTTLAMTVILLFVMTLVTLYAAKTSIKEQQISANQYRSEQSLSTANAALDWGGAYYGAARGKFCKKETTKEACLALNGVCILNKTLVDIIDNNEAAECAFIYNEDKDNQLYIAPDVTEDTYHKKALSNGKSEMYYAFVDGGVEYPHIKVDGGRKPDIYKAPVKIYGVGHSDDDTGMRIVSVEMNTSNIFGKDGPGGLNYPFISREVEAYEGAFKVVNRFANNTIWAGDEQGLKSGMKTYVSDPALDCKLYANHDKCVSPGDPNPEDVMRASEGKDDVNSDIIDGDTNIGELTRDDFFFKFFGYDKDGMKEKIKQNGGLIETSESCDDLLSKPLVWIDDACIASIGEVGTEDEPVLLIIDGDFKPGGNVYITGIVYVIGVLDPGSNIKVKGVVIVENGVIGSGVGNTTFVFDNDLINGVQGPPPGTVATTTPGSWKDWK